MPKTKKCRIKGCDFDVYVESRCYRHFKTEDRVKETDEAKAQGDGDPGAVKKTRKMAHPAGTKATETNPAREDSVSGDEDDK